MEGSLVIGRDHLNLEELPHNCPFCHRSITPRLLGGNKRDQHTWDVYMVCPHPRCQASFVAYYYAFDHYNDLGKLKGVSKGNFVGKVFSETIQDVCSSFTTIYNQALAAEQQELTEICGMGYRKALEFLIKDYAILKHPDNAEEIRSQLLGQTIGAYVSHTKIQSVAERASWLGNDETHYVRKWADKNLEDLKLLIELTIRWIEMEVLTDSFEQDMPKPEKDKNKKNNR